MWHRLRAWVAAWGNCHLKAWGRFVNRGGYLILRRSPFSRFALWETPWYWWPFAVVGLVLQHAGSWITFLGWLLRWRGFYHASWAVNLGGEWWEWVPFVDKTAKRVPPILFRGHWQKVDVTAEQHHQHTGVDQ